MVQPLACSDDFAARPNGPGDEEVPPLRLTVPLIWPAVSKEIRILSTLVWLRAQLDQVLVKLVAKQVLNMLAGKEVILLQ